MVLRCCGFPPQSAGARSSGSTGIADGVQRAALQRAQPDRAGVRGAEAAPKIDAERVAVFFGRLMRLVGTP